MKHFFASYSENNEQQIHHWTNIPPSDLSISDSIGVEPVTKYIFKHRKDVYDFLGCKNSSFAQEAYENCNTCYIVGIKNRKLYTETLNKIPKTKGWHKLLFCGKGEVFVEDIYLK